MNNTKADRLPKWLIIKKANSGHISRNKIPETVL